jgi:hypothetical protein
VAPDKEPIPRPVLLQQLVTGRIGPGIIRALSWRHLDENRPVNRQRPMVHQALDRGKPASVVPATGVRPSADKRNGQCRRQDKPGSQSVF